MALKHVILGLLHYGPRSGWDLKRQFDRSVGTLWSTSDSQLYAELGRLRKAGLVRDDAVVQGRAGPKKIQAITDAGEEELRTWLSADFQVPEAKDDFQVKMLFLWEAPEEVRRSQVEQFLAYLRDRLDYLNEQYELFREPRAATPRAGTIAWQVHVLELTLQTTQTQIRWANQLLEQMSGADDAPGTDPDPARHGGTEHGGEDDGGEAGRDGDV